MRVLAAVCAIALAGAARAASADHEQEIQAWRNARIAKLTAPDGWLTLIGLHFLREGDNTIGRDQSNDIVVPKGPSRLGTARLGGDGRVLLSVASPEARVDGEPRERAELRIGEGSTLPTLVTVDSLTLFIIDRGGRKALRVRDSEAERRRTFAGLEYFPIDPAWRIEAQWIAFERAQPTPFTNILGQRSIALVPGKAVFHREGRTFELQPFDDGPGTPLYFVISDATSGRETYEAARFVYIDRPVDGQTRVVVDFNRAQNPPCAFTPFATCPLPPAPNRLPFPVRAGEKNYRDVHE